MKGDLVLGVRQPMVITRKTKGTKMGGTFC